MGDWADKSVVPQDFALGKEYGMNRLIRAILYITAGCVGIGGAALILGLVLGGGYGGSLKEDSIFQRAKNAARDVVAIADKRKGIGSSDYGYVIEENVLYGLEQEETLEAADAYEVTEVMEGAYVGDDGEKVFRIAASKVQNMEIELRYGYLAIAESDNNAQILVSVSDTKDKDYITVEYENGELVVRDGRKGKSIHQDVTVYMEIPAGKQFQAVQVSVNAGYMETDCTLKADRFTANVDAGQICLNEITADVFSASVGAGEMDIEDGVFRVATLNCGLGSIDIEADITGDTQIDCGMGTVDLGLAKGVDSVNYALHCGVGNIDIGDNSYSGLAREKKIDNGASATFTLNCGMGEICID